MRGALLRRKEGEPGDLASGSVWGCEDGLKGEAGAGVAVGVSVDANPCAKESIWTKHIYFVPNRIVTIFGPVTQ